MSDEMLEFFAPETAKKTHNTLETHFEVVSVFKTKKQADCAQQLLNRLTVLSFEEVREVAE